MGMGTIGGGGIGMLLLVLTVSCLTGTNPLALLQMAEQAQPTQTQSAPTGVPAQDEAGKEDEIRQILNDAGVVVLDGEVTEVHGVGFAGVKGFAGGFGRGALGPWGEHAIKSFVQEAVDEALKLEAALARLRTQRRIAVLHYAPIRATVEGEPVEAFIGIYQYDAAGRRTFVRASLGVLD